LPPPIAAGVPTEAQLAAAAQQLITNAVLPLASNSALRSYLLEVRRLHEQTIDTSPMTG
jgi:hypothetical protein